MTDTSTSSTPAAPAVLPLEPGVYRLTAPLGPFLHDKRMTRDWRARQYAPGKLFLLTAHPPDLQVYLLMRPLYLTLGDCGIAFQAEWASRLKRIPDDQLTPDEYLHAVAHHDFASEVLDELHARGLITLTDVMDALERAFARLDGRPRGE